MSRRNSRDGMDRIPQGYQGNVDPPTGYSVPFGHFPWNMPAHQPVPAAMRPPMVPGQQGSRAGGGEDIVNFYKNLPALHDGLGEHSRNSYTGGQSRPQQSQMNYQSHNMPMRFPPPLLSDRVEAPNKEKSVNQRPFFPLSQACHPPRGKQSQENRIPQNLHMPNAMGSMEQMRFPGMSFPQVPPEYNYPTLSQMLERDGNFSRGPSVQCGPLPPWIPQMTPSQRIPHMANLMPPQVRNASPNVMNEAAVSRESPIETFPEDDTSPGLIGRWYKLPTEEKSVSPENVKKGSDSVQSSVDEVVKDLVTEKDQTAASVYQNALPASVGTVGATRLGRLQNLVDRLRASKENSNEISNANQGHVSRETITISPEAPTIQSTSQESTIRISPEIPGIPLKASEVLPNKSASIPNLPKRDDSGISILNCFSLTNDTKDSVPIVIDEESSELPDKNFMPDDLQEKQTETTESFLPPNSQGISEIIIPASTLTIEANEISCTEKSAMQNNRLSVEHIEETSVTSSKPEAMDIHVASAASAPMDKEQAEKLATTEKPRKESDQFRIKLKMSCTSESGIICRFSKIASAGISSKYSENILRDSPDAKKTQNTPTHSTESGSHSVQIESKQQTKDTDSLPIKTSSLFQNVHKNREKKTMHVQPLQQVMQNTVTNNVEKTDTIADSSAKETEMSCVTEKLDGEHTDKSLDVPISSELRTSVTPSDNVLLEQTADIITSNVDKTDVNSDRTVTLPPNPSVLSEKYMPIQSSDSSETENSISACIQSVEKPAVGVTENMVDDSGTTDVVNSLKTCDKDSTKSVELAGETTESIVDSSHIEKSNESNDSLAISPTKSIVAPNAQMKKTVKRSKKKKRKIIGKRIGLSSSKHTKQKKMVKDLSQQECSQKDNGSLIGEFIKQADESTRGPADCRLNTNSGENCASTLMKPISANKHSQRTEGSKSELKGDPSEALEVVYKSCMKNIEIPSHRSYYSSKIFKKKPGGDKKINKKCKKKAIIPLIPDLVNPIQFVKFHEKQLMCLKMTTGKYLIMRELLKSCFFTDPRQGVMKYKQIFLAKERDLNIPYVELCSSLRHRVVQYLKDKKHLTLNCKATHVGIISVPDALRLYHFFKGVKLCGTTCVEDDEGAETNASENRLHGQEASGKTGSPSMLTDSDLSTQNQMTNVLSQISEDVVRSSSSDKGISTSQDSLSDIEQGCQSDDSDATIPYIDGIALKRQHLEDVRSVKSKRFKCKKNSLEKDCVVRGGVAELYGYAFRFIVLDGKKFLPFEDLCFYFEEKGVYDIVQQSCFQVYGCSNSEVMFLSNLDSILPKLQENKSMVVEEDVLHAIAGNAKSILQNFFKYKWQKLRQKNCSVESKPTDMSESKKIPPESDQLVAETEPELNCESENDRLKVDKAVDENMTSTFDEVMTTELVVPSPMEGVSSVSSPPPQSMTLPDQQSEFPAQTDSGPSLTAKSISSSSLPESTTSPSPCVPPVTSAPQPEEQPVPSPQTDSDPVVMGEVENQWLASQQVMTKAFLALMKQNTVLKDRISDLDKEMKTMKEQRQSMELLVKKYEEMLAVIGEECG